MAFTLQVIRGSTTYTISDPFSLEGAEGMGGASVRNIEESGPYQDGTTHLDERLDPRTITLKLNVIGTSSSALDGYRDTLMAMFKPVRGVPITLKVTRDDGTVRQIDTRRTGPLDIPLVAINRPGNLHRAVVQLRAADPLWYNPTQGTVTYTFGTASAWWTANGSIPNANALVHVTSPTAGQAWGGATTITAGSPWTFVIRSGSAITNGYAYDSTDLAYFHFRKVNPTDYGAFGGAFDLRVDDTVQAGTSSYFVVYNGGTLSLYRGTSLIGTDTGGTPDAINTGNGKWRSDFGGANTWTEALSYAAIYNIALGTAQINALHNVMIGSVTSSFGTSIAYVGDYDSYPVITLQGTINDPVITNETTGDTLNFSGGTLGPSDVWTIDLRYGNKTAYNQSGSSIANYLSESSDLATFRLVPAPLAAGGTNTISLSGGSAGTATQFTMTYYQRYLSY